MDVSNVFEPLDQNESLSEEHLVQSRLQCLMELRRSGCLRSKRFAHNHGEPSGQLVIGVLANSSATSISLPPNKTNTLEALPAHKIRAVGSHDYLRVIVSELRKNPRQIGPVEGAGKAPAPHKPE